MSEEYLLEKLKKFKPASHEYGEAYLAMFNHLGQKLDLKKLKKEACRAFGKDLDDLPDWEFSALGKVAYLCNRDVVLSTNSKRWLEAKLSRLRGKEPQPREQKRPQSSSDDLAEALVAVINNKQIDSKELNEIFASNQLDRTEATRVHEILSKHFGQLARCDLKRIRLAQRSDVIRRRWAYEAVRKQLESMIRDAG